MMYYSLQLFIYLLGSVFVICLFPKLLEFVFALLTVEFTVPNASQ